MSDFASVRTDLTGVGATTGIAMSTKSSGVATFRINGVDVSVQVSRDLTVAVGDVCVVQRVGAEWFAVARFYPAAVTVLDLPVVPTPKPATVTGTLIVPAVETRSYRPAGWRTDTDDVIQGEYAGGGNHIGAAFYGTKPTSLSGATVTAATVRMKRRGSGGLTRDQVATLRLVTEDERPTGAPTLTSSTTGPSLRWGESATVTIPTAWAQAMVDGTAGGIAIYESDGDPYMVLDGRGRSSANFAMIISWQR